MQLSLTRTLLLFQAWTDRAKGHDGDAADGKKRKRAEEERSAAAAEDTAHDAKKKKPLESASRLSAFAFNQN